MQPRSARALSLVPFTLLGLGLAACFGSTSGGVQHDAGVFTSDSGFPTGDDSGIRSDATADGSASVGLPTTMVDLGLTNCGSAPTPKTYHFENTGPVPITWSAAADSIFSIQPPSSGTLAPGASGSLSVGASALPATSTAGTAITGTLTITTDVPGFTSVKVPLQVTPQGGSLTLTPSTVGVGTVALGSSSSLTFALANVGNAPVSVTLGAPTDGEFSIAYTGAPAAATIAAGASLAGASMTFTPTGTGAKTATAAIQTTGALCASPATAIDLSGTASAAPVSIGPSPLDFGATSCGKAAAAQAVTITSGFGGVIHFTAALGKGASSPYAIDAPSGTVPGNGIATIHVTPAAIPVPGDITAGAYDDALTVTTDAPGATPVVISLEQSASGAILTPSMNNTSFGPVGSVPGTLPFVVTNTGNAAAAVIPKVTGTGFSASLSGSATAAAGGGTVNGTATFSATKNGPASGTLTVTSTDPVCNVPPAIDMSATGAFPVASFPTTQLPISGICGGSLTAVALIVQNTGAASLVVSNLASKAGLFTASVSPASAPPGGSVTITLQPVIPAGALGGSSATDTLTFSTNEAGSPAYSVPVKASFHGANLSLSPATVAVNCNNTPWTFSNTGDMAASVYVSGPYPDDLAFSFGGTLPTVAPGVTVGVGGSGGDTVGRNLSYIGCGAEACVYSGTETFTTLGSTGTSAGVCVALPPLGLSMNYPSCGSCC